MLVLCLFWFVIAPFYKGKICLSRGVTTDLETGRDWPSGLEQDALSVLLCTPLYCALSAGHSDIVDSVSGGDGEFVGFIHLLPKSRVVEDLPVVPDLGQSDVPENL